MSIHLLDLAGYFVVMILVDILTPDQLKFRADRELGAVAGLIIYVVTTIIYVTLFVFIDFNVADIIGVIEINFKK